MKVFAVSLIVLSSACPCFAQERAEAYHAMLVLSGYLLRTGAVCKGQEARRTIDKALRYASNGEMRDFTRAFPKLSKDWMMEGAAHFNEDVLNKGIVATCAEGFATAKKAP